MGQVGTSWPIEIFFKIFFSLYHIISPICKIFLGGSTYQSIKAQKPFLIYFILIVDGSTRQPMAGARQVRSFNSHPKSNPPRPILGWLIAGPVSQLYHPYLIKGIG